VGQGVQRLAGLPGVARHVFGLAPADGVVFGRPFISNPDLVERFRLDAALSPCDVRTFYGGDDHGYTDYPTLGNTG
jgi:2,4-dienoyl-CoA reductase-like NADH-dependent reductase (Old Yellow Enzyme family)